MSCTHESTVDIHTSGYSGSVAVHPYTEEDRRAHGGVCVTVECRACGARRHENRNQRWAEVSPWGPSRAWRQAQVDSLARLRLPDGTTATIRPKLCADGTIARRQEIFPSRSSDRWATAIVRVTLQGETREYAVADLERAVGGPDVVAAWMMIQVRAQRVLQAQAEL